MIMRKPRKVHIRTSGRLFLLGTWPVGTTNDSSRNLIRGFVLLLTAFYRTVRLHSEMGRDCWASAVLIGNYSPIHSILQNLSTVPEKSVMCYGGKCWCLAMGHYRDRMVDNSVLTGLRILAEERNRRMCSKELQNWCFV